eukprot:CAMPEP_0175860564 /NCGR_PEP_ID=MMETSP0107_2-20121207/30884_1 /TAXON_ID=195067 ORGANISM="Goniomonas pacifica, Strain CCMP1869" /NCGR_SAMPLE_ID=MMETSP0107_2 /ASSEMBLY_ACC=CAM_ASM_000203 /LENGTH=48 /DNA_ID= /DNA_START= /DNA_END= /DNA_ORIENTATION=
MIPPPEIPWPIMPQLVSDGLGIAVGFPLGLLSLPTCLIGLPFMFAERK